MLPQIKCAPYECLWRLETTLNRQQLLLHDSTKNSSVLHRETISKNHELGDDCRTRDGLSRKTFDGMSEVPSEEDQGELPLIYPAFVSLSACSTAFSGLLSHLSHVRSLHGSCLKPQSSYFGYHRERTPPCGALQVVNTNKRQCDERPDGCLKCSNKGYTCPGYDTTLDRYFQDESAHVKEKAKKSKAKAIAQRDERDKKEKARTAIIRVQEYIGHPLLSPLIDQGINFFMMNYTLGLDQPPIQSAAYNRHLSTFGFHPLIATSMTALGLAGISNIFLDANFKREAMQWYLKALQMTNAALASPAEVKSDNTLFATLLLSLFEATSNEKSLAGWSNHVSGSESLIRMRGVKQFSTSAGRRMYKQVVGLVTMNCMGMGKGLPEYVLAMNKEVQKHESIDDPGYRFFYLQIDTINFRAQILHGEITDLHAIVERALELDEVAKSIFKGSGSEWDFEVIQTDYGTPGVFGNSYHIYPHIAAAQVWNWVRYTRIYIHDIIRNSLIVGFSMTPPIFVGARYIRLLEESQETLYRMQYDILASIPQHLHDTPKNLTYMPQTSSPSPSTGSLTSSDPSSAGSSRFFWSNFRVQDFRSETMVEGVSDDRIPIVRISGGYSSLWALYVAGTTPIATPESQEFVLKSMNRIASEFGINQAKILANCLKLKVHLDSTGQVPYEIVPSYLPKEGEHYEK